MRKNISSSIKVGMYPGILIGVQTDKSDSFTDIMENNETGEQVELILDVTKHELVIPMFKIWYETIYIESENEEVVDGMIESLQEQGII